MITGAISPHTASRNVRQSPPSAGVASRPQPSRIEKYRTGMSSDRPARMPGIMPAANSAGIDACGTRML